MHLECLEEEMGFVAHALAETFEFSSVEVIGEDGSVVWVGAFFDDDAGTFLWRETTDVGETL